MTVNGILRCEIIIFLSMSYAILILSPMNNANLINEKLRITSNCSNNNHYEIYAIRNLGKDFDLTSIDLFKK